MTGEGKTSRFAGVGEAYRCFAEMCAFYELAWVLETKARGGPAGRGKKRSSAMLVVRETYYGYIVFGILSSGWRFGVGPPRWSFLSLLYAWVNGAGVARGGNVMHPVESSICFLISVSFFFWFGGDASDEEADMP